MRSKKTWLTLLSTALLTMTVLAGCGGTGGNGAASNAAAQGESTAAPAAASAPVKFNFYFTGSQNVKDLWDTLVPMFEKQNDQVDVNLVYIPSGTGAEPTYDRILAAKQAGKGSGDIDLYEDGIGVVAQGTKDGVWQQLDPGAIPNLAKSERRHDERRGQLRDSVSFFRRGPGVRQHENHQPAENAGRAAILDQSEPGAIRLQ
ncbi:hypothetical protein HMSSN139_44630 [Paenibacillus sp. HMSSN-139]|nr:hypothetical protein HMSSN139_44630 [Paenibacillus sp. HMSSN-139]